METALHLHPHPQLFGHDRLSLLVKSSPTRETPPWTTTTSLFRRVAWGDTINLPVSLSIHPPT